MAQIGGIFQFFPFGGHCLQWVHAVLQCFALLLAEQWWEADGLRTKNLTDLTPRSGNKGLNLPCFFSHIRMGTKQGTAAEKGWLRALRGCSGLMMQYSGLCQAHFLGHVGP